MIFYIYKGDALYTSLTNNLSLTYLNLDDLPTTTANVADCLHGNLQSSTRLSEPFYSLNDAVEKLMNEHLMAGCILTIGNSEQFYSTCILKNEDSYYLFDSHSRNEVGMLEADGGTACLTEHRTIFALCNFVRHLAASLHLKQPVPFEMAAITLPVTPLQIGISDHSTDMDSSFSFFDPCSDGEYCCRLLIANEAIERAQNSNEDSSTELSSLYSEDQDGFKSQVDAVLCDFNNSDLLLSCIDNNLLDDSMCERAMKQSDDVLADSMCERALKQSDGGSIDADVFSLTEYKTAVGTDEFSKANCSDKFCKNVQNTGDLNLDPGLDLDVGEGNDVDVCAGKDDCIEHDEDDADDERDDDENNDDSDSTLSCTSDDIPLAILCQTKTKGASNSNVSSSCKIPEDSPIISTFAGKDGEKDVHYLENNSIVGDGRKRKRDENKWKRNIAKHIDDGDAADLDLHDCEQGSHDNNGIAPTASDTDDHDLTCFKKYK
ncbi:hypothetical protein DPMN_167981 [Dreissena polymorpha]|uniref:Uncharacterized protein n=1 Tax=Dreissena polymorpha TaxID=45954 RepID=A0A9D4F2F6_DREPO|nr:hypothetical protein DPMN_167981 [Dreissena polymorpha]